MRRYFHRLMMRCLKDWISYSMICDHCLKMLQMPGYPGMTSWIPATLTNIVDEQQKLATGKETPEEFEAAADQFIINNSK
ncbi:MAG: hypothetical protein ACLTVV_08425 [Ruminococcus sp.]